MSFRESPATVGSDGRGGAGGDSSGERIEEKDGEDGNLSNGFLEKEGGGSGLPCLHETEPGGGLESGRAGEEGPGLTESKRPSRPSEGEGVRRIREGREGEGEEE